MEREALVKKTGVTIIGGGIAGSALAYVLAKNGMTDVVLVERKELSSESSGANFASVMTTMLPLRPPLLPLFSRSLDAFPSLNEELGRDVEYRTPRVCWIRPEHLETITGMVESLNELGYGRGGFQMAELEELKKLEPHAILGSYGYIDKRGGQINPLYLTTALGDRARELGVKVYENTKVTDIKVQGHRARSVVTDRGEIETDYVVNAAGAWGPEIGAMVGLTVPIEHLKCQCIVCEVMPDEMIYFKSIIRTEYFLSDMDQSEGKMNLFGIYKQMARGTVLLGITEEPGTDKYTTYESMEAISNNSIREIPKLREDHVHIMSTFGNLYAVPPDRHVMLGPVEGLENFIMNCGYADYGIGTGYGAAELLTEMILKGDKEFPIEELRYSPRYGRYEG